MGAPLPRRIRTAAASAAVMGLIVLGLGAALPSAAARSVADVEMRDQLIANQENLLNTYRCLFGVDIDVVPGGCPSPDQVSPGPAPASPTQYDIEVRDEPIQSQEALLNVYRCRFDVDTQLVLGGCSHQTDDKPSTTETDDTSSIAPPAQSAAIGVLNGLTVEAEYAGSGYVRADFEHDRDHLCDNAGTDPYTGISFDPSTCDVDYIVAAQEAFESGAWAWDAAQRMAFGNDAENLTRPAIASNNPKARMTWPNGQDGLVATFAKQQS